MLGLLVGATGGLPDSTGSQMWEHAYEFKLTAGGVQGFFLIGHGGIAPLFVTCTSLAPPVALPIHSTGCRTQPGRADLGHLQWGAGGLARGECW